jgi:hypothetical protein
VICSPLLIWEIPGYIIDSETEDHAEILKKFPYSLQENVWIIPLERFPFHILKNSSFTTIPAFNPEQLVQLIKCDNNMFLVSVVSELSEMCLLYGTLT